MGEHRKLIERAWAIMESRELHRLGEVLAPDVEFGMSGGVKARGLEGFRAMLQGWLDGFPDLRHEIRETLEGSDAIAVRLWVRGTHKGTLQSPQGAIPATGKEVVWDSVDWVKVRDGKVVSWSVYEDGMAFLAQLGLAPK